MKQPTARICTPYRKNPPRQLNATLSSCASRRRRSWNGSLSWNKLGPCLRVVWMQHRGMPHGWTSSTGCRTWITSTGWSGCSPPSWQVLLFTYCAGRGSAAFSESLVRESVACLPPTLDVTMKFTAEHVFVKDRREGSSRSVGLAKTVSSLQVAFLLPTLILLLLYVSIIFLHVYRYRGWLRDAYARDFWDGARYTLALLWCGHAWVWHGEFPPQRNSALTFQLSQCNFTSSNRWFLENRLSCSYIYDLL